MKKLGITANCYKRHAPEILHKLGIKAEKLGLKIYAEKSTAGFIKTAVSLDMENLYMEADAIMALGGDGTMLRTVRYMGTIDKPVIGVNIGGLGFLTSVAENDLNYALQCLSKDDFTLSTRSIIESIVEHSGEEIGEHKALNDVIVRSNSLSRIVELDLAIDGNSVTTYDCDGLIVSTPTGSTGHSLSAGGPILPPDTDAFVISFICPHTLSSRPLVVSDKCEIRITAGDKSGMLLTIDGKIDQILTEKDSVVIKRSNNHVRFIHLPGYDYFSVLRQKLHWSGSSI